MKKRKMEAGNKLKKLNIVLVCLLILTIYSIILSGQAQGQPITHVSNASEPAHVQVGVWIIDIQKIDLSASTYRLDFYLWFSFDPSHISTADVSQFEFVNGQPNIKQIDVNDYYLEYRVTGDFVRTFDFTNYPFESHPLYIELEHENLDNTQLIYDLDNTSYIEPTAGVSGWDVGSLQTQVLTHSYGDQSFSRPEFDVVLSRPLVSGIIKSVLPLAIITGISLLAFAMAAEDYSNKMALGITTLLSATAFHLSLLSGIPPTGYLTFADRMMIAVYILFLFNIGSAVYLMTLARKNKKQQANAYNSKAQKILPIIVIVLVVMTILI
jgi:hypothetical protein